MVRMPSVTTWKWLGTITAAVIASLLIGYYNRNVSFADRLCCTDSEISERQLEDRAAVRTLTSWSVSHADEEKDFKNDIRSRLDRIERKLDRLR